MSILKRLAMADHVLRRLYGSMVKYAPDRGPWMIDENGVRRCYVCNGEYGHVDGCAFVEMERYLKRNPEDGP